MTFDEYDYTIGQWAVCAIEYDDRSDLTDTDETALDAFLATLPPGGHWVWGEENEYALDEISGLYGACVAGRYLVPVRAAA